jgi:hypothetical protein
MAATNRTGPKLVPACFEKVSRAFGDVHIFWSFEEMYMELLNVGAALYCTILIHRLGRGLLMEAVHKIIR